MDESDIPIDIHTNKLMDWLISRRHVQRDWQTKVVHIREKINEAIKDMPENKEITVLLTGSYINYFHCLRLIEILKETEADTKNLFGRYSSKRMNDWLEIVKLYSKENIYLAEVGSLLLRNINYEIPALKKQITKTVNTINEYERKEVDYQKLANSNKKEFIASCKALNIKGEKIKKELLDKAESLPEMNKKLAGEAKILKEAINYYQKTFNSLLNNDEEVLKMLSFVIEHGDTTVYEWKYGKPPTSVEETKLTIEEEESNENSDTIDFGLDLDLNAQEEDIDWGISTEDSSDPVLQETDDSRAVGEEARTILGNPNTRKLFLNDVLELEAFLKVRLYEMNNDSDNFSSGICSDLQIYGTTTVQKMSEDVEIVLKKAKDANAVHFLNITTNPRYVYQLAEKLENKMKTVEKLLASKEFVQGERESISKEIEPLNSKVQLLIQKSKELQSLIEEEISKKYNGRPVNLIAGANLL